MKMRLPKRVKQKVYRTKRLELREFKLTDWRAWAQAHGQNTEKLDEWDLSPVPEQKRTQSRYKRQLLAQRKRFKKSGVFLWCMFVRNTGEFIGWIDISHIAAEPYLIANLGWFTMNRHRKKGYAREAVTKLISAAFTDLGYHRLEASINPRNKASIQMARSLGLHYEGIKKFYQKENGVWHDTVSFITTPELFYENP